ncbi:hypothetical protein GCM10027194_26650 [Thalassiella azotivora]
MTAALGVGAGVAGVLVDRPLWGAAGLAAAGVTGAVQDLRAGRARHRRHAERVARRRALLEVPLADEAPVVHSRHDLVAAADPVLDDGVVDDVALVPGGETALRGEHVPAASAAADADVELGDVEHDDDLLLAGVDDGLDVDLDVDLDDALDDAPEAVADDEPEDGSSVSGGRHAGDVTPVDYRVDTAELQRMWDAGTGPDTGPLPVIPAVPIIEDGQLVTAAPEGKQAVLVQGLSSAQVVVPSRRKRHGTLQDRVFDALARHDHVELTRLLDSAVSAGGPTTSDALAPHGERLALPAGSEQGSRRRGRHAA